ncbi:MULTISPECIES: hypothetical protein [Lacrimispora]|jgi:hypothetical protein|uniref:Uncharacterized protein n=1 Tax=Lacrimispora defluvii TaxID=2719233 RepID=A0ABX1VQS1_9FIRM|nr:hypothetical protein [Lacrimispora defluvii]NNJ30345.1 hypothetical protein [Lacrimispora defluvii]
MDVQLAYYMFVNHGRFPGEVARLPENDRILMFQMAVKEINSRPKK